MKERPILFSGEMVRAILEGRKTQTRRVIKNQAHWWKDVWRHPYGGWIAADAPKPLIPLTQYDKKGGFPCPYGQVGDRLWVREALHKDMEKKDTIYDLDCQPVFYNGEFPKLVPWKWEKIKLPSIFMPRWASRITLEITSIRVERLQEIKEEDAIAEGVAIDRGHCYEVAGHPVWVHNTARTCFETLWDSINGKKYPWESNLWVWVIEFKRL